MVLRNQEGMALVLAIMLLLVLFVMGSTLLMMTTTDVKIAHHQVRDNRALFVADAGIQEVLARMTSDSLYIGDTVGYVRSSWQSEIYAKNPPAGSGDTLTFEAILSDTGLKYGDQTAPVVVHYLKDRNEEVVFYDPESKERFPGSSAPIDARPVLVVEATGVEPSAGYPVRRKAITEFIISSADYDSFNYAIHTGRGLYLKGGRLVTCSGKSDQLTIARTASGDTLFIDVSPPDSIYQMNTEASFFINDWDLTYSSGPYDLLRMPNTWGGYPLNYSPPPNGPDLSLLGNKGWVFANGDITLDTSGIFTPKLGETWLVGDTNNFFILDTAYIYSAHTYVADSLAVPQIDMSLDYWRYQGAKIIDRLHPDSIPYGWSADYQGYHWVQNNNYHSMDSGLYYFSDLPVTIDTTFTASGNVRIVTPFSIAINRDVTYSEGEPKTICFMAGEDILLGGNVLVKAVLYAKSGDVKIMNNAVVLGSVIVGGHAVIGGYSAVILDERLNTSGFRLVDDDKKYVSTVLSWREVTP